MTWHHALNRSVRFSQSEVHGDTAMTLPVVKIIQYRSVWLGPLMEVYRAASHRDVVFPAEHATTSSARSRRHAFKHPSSAGGAVQSKRLLAGARTVFLTNGFSAATTAPEPS